MKTNGVRLALVRWGGAGGLWGGGARVKIGGKRTLVDLHGLCQVVPVGALESGTGADVALCTGVGLSGRVRRCRDA